MHWKVSWAVLVLSRAHSNIAHCQWCVHILHCCWIPYLNFRALQVLESLALDEPIPEQIVDETMPDLEGMESKQQQILAFRVRPLFLASPFPIFPLHAHCIRTAVELSTALS